MHCHAHQEKPAKHQETKQQTKPETNNQKPHTPKSGDMTSTSLWVKRSIKAGGDNLVSSRNMHNDILCAMLTQAHRINNNKTNPKITMGHFGGCRKQQSSMRKPGIPPARIPEITKSSLHGMTFTLTLWCKHRQSRVATKVVRRTTAVKLESETWSKVKWQWDEGAQGTLRVRSVVLFQSSYP